MFALTAVFVILATVLPAVIRSKLHAGIEKMVIIDSFDSEGYLDWTDSTRPNAAHQIMSFYMFNITNPDQVLNGSKPILQELPPLVYHMVEQNFNVSFSADKTIISYQNWLRFYPTPETVALSKQNITTINMPFQGLIGRNITAIGEIIDGFFHEKEMLFVNRPMNDTLFGYFDEMLWKLSKIEKSLNPRYRGLQVNATDLAWADNNCSTIRMYTGVGHPELLRETISWDDMASMECCNYGSCGPTNRGLGRDPAWLHAPANNFRGSMGHQFRSGLHKGDSIPLFVPQIYRTIDLQNYNGETNTIHGATAYRFRIPPEAFNNGSTTPANIGYWANGPNGVLNVSACEFKAAVFMSKPHFLHGDPSLVTAVEGLTPPNPALHDAYLDVEPLTGATINVAFRLQINALISRVHGVLSGDDLFGKVDPTYVPLLWFERAAVANAADGRKITDQLYVARDLAVAFFWLGIAGSVVFGLAFFYTFSKYRKFEENHARTTEPLLPSSKYDE